MLTLIAAVSDNNVIGHKGKMPWNIPEDLKRFKSLTLHHPLIMGRKTFESLPVRPLKDRANIVVTRNPEALMDYREKGVIVAGSVLDAIEHAGNYDSDPYVIGGAEIYQQTFDRANALEITRVHGNFEGDAFFPVISPSEWMEVNREERGGYDFLSYIRR